MVTILEPAECHIWWADPDLVPGSLQELLDQDERVRYQQYRRPDDQRRFLAGRSLLRLAAADYLGLTPQLVSVAARCPDCAVPHGRPVLPGSGIEVSLAHSGRQVAVALTRAGAVGIDVELMDPAVRVDELLPQILAPEEAQFDSVRTPGGFYRMWTRKEAVLKATGDGLRVPLTDVAVSAPATPARLTGLAHRMARPDDLVLQDLEAAAGYCAAVAVIARAPIRFVALDGDQLLRGRG